MMTPGTEFAVILHDAELERGHLCGRGKHPNPEPPNTPVRQGSSLAHLLRELASKIELRTRARQWSRRAAP
jgi:hypothetical protein